MDMLEQAKVHLDVATEEFDNGAWDNANRRAQLAQAAAQIAIAERLDKLIGILQAETGYGPIEPTRAGTEGQGSDLGILKNDKVVGYSVHPIDDLPY